MNYELEILCLKQQIKALRIQIQQQEELLYTIASPPWKRLWFFLQGYRLYKIGRWYNKTKDLK